MDAEAPPIARTGKHPVGQLDSAIPGHGLVFHSTRAHHPDDPADRIDWRHYAKRGTLVSVNYERQVQTTVWLVVDAREENRVVAGPGRPSAIELAAYACTQTLADLIRSGHQVGLCVLGQDANGPTDLRFVPAGSGRGQRARIQHELDELLDDRSSRSDISAQIRFISDLVTPGSQVAVFGPLLDDDSVTMVRRWRSVGHSVTILSPDVIPSNTFSGQFEQINRRTRLATCQRLGARTFDWRRGTPLPLIIDRAFTADARVPDAALETVPQGGGR
ncbi:MAG: DUF58 domain-containing protein [Natrialbaceae archaeon]|nr:DUF58 domain-containing protein [Natrialbaceae archaeon]